MPSIIDLSIEYLPNNTAVVTARSVFTGNTQSMSLPLTEAQFTSWRSSGAYIQTALPHLTPDQREFLLTGATPEEWDDAFGDEEEDEDRSDDEE